MTHIMFWRGAFALLFLAVTWLTVTPNPEDARAGMAFTRWLANLLFGDQALSDKVGHFAAYGALGAAACWARLTLLKRLWTVPAGLALYGVLLEGVQALGGVRSPEIADALANASGALAGFAAGLVLARLLNRKTA